MALAVYRKLYGLFQLAYQLHIRLFALSAQTAARVAAEGGRDDVYKARFGHGHAFFQGG